MERLFTITIAIAVLTGVGFGFLTGDLAKSVIYGFATLGFGWTVLVLFDFVETELRRYYTGR